MRSCKKNKNIKIYENTLAVELLVKDNECDGVIVFDEDKKNTKLFIQKF